MRHTDRATPLRGMHSRNLAARVGRWSVHHRKSAIIGWVVFVALAVLVGAASTALPPLVNFVPAWSCAVVG